MIEPAKPTDFRPCAAFWKSAGALRVEEWI